MKNSLTILICLAIVSPGIAAPSGAINGFVRDASDGEVMPYVNVFLEGTQLGSTTNEHGYFVIHKVPPGTYTLVASMIGFAQHTDTVRVQDKKTITLDIDLTAKIIEMEELVKTAERERFEREVEISTNTIQARQFNTLPMLAEADLFRTLQLLPGVVSRSDFSSQLYVRGGSPDENLVLLDGVTVYNPFHLGGLFSTFNVDAIKEVEFMTGGFPAEYGGRLSSVLSITNNAGNSKEFEGKVNISLLSAKTTLQGPIPRGSYLIAARRTYFDYLLKGTDYDFPYYFYDFQGKINVDVSPNHRLTLSGFYGDDVLDFSFEEDDETEDDFDVDIDWIWGNRTTSLNWRWIIHPDLFSEIMFTRSRFRNDLELDLTSTNTAALEIHNGITDYTAKADFSYFGIDDHGIKFGFNQSWLDFKYNIGINKLDLLDYKTAPTVRSFYMQDQWQTSEKLSVKYGGLLDHYSLGDHWRLSPRIGVKYQVQPNLAIKASSGVYYQYLTTAASEEQNFSFMDLWFPLTDQYEPLRAVHLITGIEWWLPMNLTFTTEVYYKDMRNLLDLNEDGDFANQDDDFYVGTGYARGLEFLLKRSVGRLNGWLGYSYSLTRRSINSVVYFPKHDRRHSFNLVLNYDLGRNWTAGLVFQFGSGTPYTPVLGKYTHYEWDLHNNELEEEIYNRVGPKNSASYPSYHRMDLSIRKRWKVFGIQNSPYLQIINVYNHENVFFYFWDHEADPSKLVTVKMFPIIPTFGIEFDL